LLIAALAVGCAAPVPTPSPGADKALSLRHTVRDGIVDAHIGLIDQLRIDSAYRYIGGQRFILQNTADAEQHIFADIDSTGQIRRLYWIQFEEMLPDQSGSYDYSADATVTVAGLPMRVNAGRHTALPPRESDRAAVYRLLERAGFKAPLPATRVRLIYLPDEVKRTELMVIYIERSDNTAQPGSAEAAGAITRATNGGLQFVRRN
jgi:hypothetical protein